MVSTLDTPKPGYDYEWVSVKKHRILLECRYEFPGKKLRRYAKDFAKILHKHPFTQCYYITKIYYDETNSVILVYIAKIEMEEACFNNVDIVEVDDYGYATGVCKTCACACICTKRRTACGEEYTVGCLEGFAPQDIFTNGYFVEVILEKIPINAAEFLSDTYSPMRLCSTAMRIGFEVYGGKELQCLNKQKNG